MRQRLQALEAQLAPKPPAAPPPNAEDEAIRQQLFKLVPGLEKLGSLTPDQVQKLLDSVPYVEEHTRHYWGTVAGAAVRQLTAAYAKTYGAPPNDRQVTTLRNMLASYVQDNDEAKQRYMAGDPALIDEFWKDYEDGFIAPIRRSTLAAEQANAARRANLPTAPTRTHALGNGSAKKPQTLDERGDAAWDAVQAAR
jgi:hypothetical protein